MKKDVFCAIVRSDETEALLPDDFFYRPCHTYLS
jgi:hypothetical protein